MEQKEILKQMIDFNKIAFDNTFNIMNLLQEQWERMTGVFVEQSAWPPQGGEILSEWASAYKKWHQDCKKALADNFKRLEVILEEPGKTERAKPVSAKPSPAKARKPQQKKPAKRKAESGAAGRADKAKFK